MKDIQKSVEKIILDIRTGRDKAISDYNIKFDKNYSKRFEISGKAIKTAYKKVDQETIKVFKKAISNIKIFSKRQLKNYKNFEIKINKNSIGQKVIPIEKVGVYVPGGNYPYPSSAIMAIIPAKVAGCKEIVVCSPKISNETIVAANLAGATKILNIGGVQAIAGMAIGTKQIPKVDKIVGPGNQYVAEAKRQLYGEVGIDFIAGPSELCIIADETSNPSYIAADLLAQAEHDTNAKVFLISNDENTIKKVKQNIRLQLISLKTRLIAEKSIKKLKIFFYDDIDEAINIADDLAPEHLSIMTKYNDKLLKKLMNYGSLFMGGNSAEVFGDYFSGTNHILPTNKASRYTNGLNVGNFIKLQTYQKISEKGLRILKPIAKKFAEIEGLEGHKKSAEIR